MDRRRTLTHRFALGTLVFNVGVIVWGAFVRATGSGAGCGDHWPTCNGEVVPRPERIETLIEFTHRATSGVALLLTVALLVLAMRAFPARHRARRAAGASMIFMIGEAVVGALLVLNHLVADNDSVLRAAIMGVHLVNTFLLLGGFTLTWWFAQGGAPIRMRDQGIKGAMLGATVVSCLLLGASGGITALGDTLFPAASLAEGLAQDFSPTAHLLVRLRVLHPLLAVGTAGLGVVTAGVAWGSSRSPQVHRAALAVAVLFGTQLLAGGVNLLLAAPVWMQLLHLFLADLVWMAVVLLAATALAHPAPERSPTAASSQHLQVV